MREIGFLFKSTPGYKRKSGERPLQKTAAVHLTWIYKSGGLTGCPVFKGLKPLILHEQDWEGEPKSQESQKTCQEEPVLFFGLRMWANNRNMFSPPF